MVPLNGRRISPIPRIRDRPRSLPPVGGHDLRVESVVRRSSVEAKRARYRRKLRRPCRTEDASRFRVGCGHLR